MEHKTDLEKNYAFQRKGKKYKTKYFSALKQLFGAIQNDKENQEQNSTRIARTDTICIMAKKSGI